MMARLCRYDKMMFELKTEDMTCYVFSNEIREITFQQLGMFSMGNRIEDKVMVLDNLPLFPPESKASAALPPQAGSPCAPVTAAPSPQAGSPCASVTAVPSPQGGSLYTLPSSLPVSWVMADFIALLFCTGGCLELDVDGRRHSLRQGDILFLGKGASLSLHAGKRASGMEGDALAGGEDMPQSRREAGEAFQGKALCVSWEYSQCLFLRNSCRWCSIAQIKGNPLLHPNRQDRQLFHAYYQLFAIKLRTYCYAPQDGIDCILQGFLHDFYLMLERYATPSPGHPGGEGCSYRKEELFKHFITLLKEEHAREHFVPYYAGRLCVTPKYLTTVVKQVSGRTVSKWIDLYLMEEVRLYLKNTSLTVSEIAIRLNFSNSSFFGKFVKAQTGKTPLQLRQALQAAGR